MSKNLFTASAMILAASFMAASLSASAGTLPAGPDTPPPIVLVSGGCGFAFHRNPFGACVPNGGFYGGPGPYARLPPPCPRGYHRDPDPARRLCYPNF